MGLFDTKYILLITLEVTTIDCHGGFFSVACPNKLFKIQMTLRQIFVVSRHQIYCRNWLHKAYTKHKMVPFLNRWKVDGALSCENGGLHFQVELVIEADECAGKFYSVGLLSALAIHCFVAGVFSVSNQNRTLTIFGVKLLESSNSVDTIKGNYNDNNNILAFKKHFSETLITDHFWICSGLE